MRTRTNWISRSLPVAMVALLATATTVRAQAPTPGPDAVVATIGAQTITLGELDGRIASIPPFQLRTLGKTAEEIRRNLLERILVRDRLFAEAARGGEVARDPQVADRVGRVLRGAIYEQIRLESSAAEPVTDEEVRAYYEGHPEKFRAPPRIAIWRILVATKEEAQKVIEEAGKDLSLKTWNELAREHSLDRATNMRGGNLGFVAPDGTTPDVGVKVAPILFEAASRVKDAELVREPVPEGARFAVVWRRQSMREITRTMEQESTSIRQVLVHEKADGRVKALLTKLRGEYVTDFAPELVDTLDVTASGGVQPMRRPGALPLGRRHTKGRPGPVEGPGGLR